MKKLEDFGKAFLGMSKPYEAENRAGHLLVSSTTSCNNVLEKLDYLGVQESKRNKLINSVGQDRDTSLATVVQRSMAIIRILD